MLNQYLNEKEQKFAVELLQSGLENACRSFSSLAKQKVEFSMGKFSIFKFQNDLNDHIEITKSGKLVLLTTEVIGEIHGMSYLLFDQAEVAEINNSCLPSGIPLEEKEKISEAVLKELDNILSAAVITQISNKLNVRIFGDVPHYRETSNSELNELLTEEFNSVKLSNENLFLSIDSKFVFENQHSLRPDFIWRLSERFLNLIKEKST